VQHIEFSMPRFPARSARISLALLLLGLLACRARVLVGRELPIAAEPAVSADAGPDAARAERLEDDADNDDGEQMMGEQMMGENNGDDGSNN
jgi:hypothetical protein